MTFDDPFSHAPRSASMRVGDAEREQASDGLRRHHAEGRLTDAEFEQRVARCYAARTVGELDHLFADLPRHDRGLAVSGGPRSRELLRGAHPFVLVVAAIAALWVIGGVLSAFAPWGWYGPAHAHPPFFLAFVVLFVVWRLVARRGRRRRSSAF